MTEGDIIQEPNFFLSIDCLYKSLFFSLLAKLSFAKLVQSSKFFKFGIISHFFLMGTLSWNSKNFTVLVLHLNCINNALEPCKGSKVKEDLVYFEFARSASARKLQAQRP